MQPFTYMRVGTAAGAVRAVAAGGHATRFLAGGTTLYDLMKLNVETPETVIDLTHIKELDGIDTSGADLVFGALARMSDVAAHPKIVAEYPALSESLWRGGPPPPRHIEALGGDHLPH